MINRKIGRIINFLFIYLPIFIVSVWLGQTIGTILVNGIFSYFHPFGLSFISFHSMTGLFCFSFFLFLHVIFLRKLPVYVRIVISAALPCFGLLFYDFIYSLLDFTILHRANPLIQFSLLFFCFIILYFYNRKFDFLGLNILFMFFVGWFILSVLLLVTSDFFQQIYLYDTAGGPDPHNLVWLQTKFVTIWMWIGVLRK